MDMTAEFTIGLGRTFKAVREREGLTQKELAVGMGVSVQQIKRHEQENPALIGSQGFSISMLTRLSDYLNTHPATLFAEILSHSQITQRDDRERELRKVLAAVASNSLDVLLAAKSKREKAPFGNVAVWNLEMAANLARLPAKARARVGVEILRALVDGGIASRKEVDDHQRQLFEFSVS